MQESAVRTNAGTLTRTRTFTLGEWKMKKCVICGKNFEENHTKRIYCSAACAKNAQTQQIRDWGSKNYHYTPRTIICSICGKPVEALEGPCGSRRIRFHTECLEDDIISTITSGKSLSKLQNGRKYRLGITNRDIKEMCDADTKTYNAGT